MSKKSKLPTGPTLDEMACIYCALILADDDVPITAEKIDTLLKAADIQVESIWPSMYARALQAVDIKQLITNVGAGSFSGGALGVAAAPTKAVAEEESKPEEKKAEEPEEDESDEDFGLSLFD